MDIRTKMMRLMSAEGCVLSSIEAYAKMYDHLVHYHGELQNRDRFYWIDYLAGVKNWNTRNLHRSVILKVCNGVFEMNMNLPYVKKIFVVQPTYSQQECIKIISTIKYQKHLAMAYLLYDASFRVNEIVNCFLSDYNAELGTIILRSTKNKNDVIKYLSVSCNEVIKKYLQQETPIRYLFEGWVKGEKYSIRSVQQIMNKAIRLSGLEKKGTTHIFRRSSGTWKHENGWSLKSVADSLGNSVKTTAKYYSNIRPEYLNGLRTPMQA